VAVPLQVYRQQQACGLRWAAGRWIRPAFAQQAQQQQAQHQQ
jgi:hypothetical protein